MIKTVTKMTLSNLDLLQELQERLSILANYY